MDKTTFSSLMRNLILAYTENKEHNNLNVPQNNIYELNIIEQLPLILRFDQIHIKKELYLLIFPNKKNKLSGKINLDYIDNKFLHFCAKSITDSDYFDKTIDLLYKDINNSQMKKLIKPS